MTGRRNRHMPMLITAWEAIMPNTPAQMIWPARSPERRPTQRMRMQMASSRIKMAMHPKNPSSSPQEAKIKSLYPKGILPP